MGKSDIQQRLEKYLKTKSFNYKEFEELCGLSGGAAAKLSNTSRQSTLKRISNACDLNVRWLMLGDGPMLRPDAPEPVRPERPIINLEDVKDTRVNSDPILVRLVATIERMSERWEKAEDAYKNQVDINNANTKTFTDTIAALVDKLK